MVANLLLQLKSDERLMQAYAQGQVEAFELLYQRHKDALYSFIYLIKQIQLKRFPVKCPECSKPLMHSEILERVPSEWK